MSAPECSLGNISPTFDTSSSPQADLPAQVTDAAVLGQKRTVAEEDGGRSTKRRHINLGMSAWRGSA